MVNKKTEKKITLKTRYKTIAKGSFYSILQSYTNYIQAVLTSFLLARMISKDLWGYLIIANSYILLFTFFIGFFPPGLDSSLNYYVPHYRAQNLVRKLKSFILKCLSLKLLAILLVFIISIILIFRFSNLFSINLNGFYYLLYLLIPLLIISPLDNFFLMVNKGFGKFNFVFILSLTKAFLILSFYFFLFFFINPVRIEYIVFANIFSVLIPLLINLLLVVKIFFSLKKTSEEGLGYKIVFKNIMNYGSYITIQSFINKYWNEIVIQSIGIFQPSYYVVGYTIAKRYRELVTVSIQSLNEPFIVSLSNLNVEKDSKLITKIYQISLKYSFFFISFITGILILLRDFFLFFIYGESYLNFSLILMLFLISLIFNPIGNLFMIFLKALNKVKFIPLIEIIITITGAITLYIGLIYFGIYGMMIGIITNNFFIFVFFTFLNKKILKINLNYFIIFKQIIIFLISILITTFFGVLFFNNLNNHILSFLGLSFFKLLNLFSLALYIITFFILNFVLKVITKTDIEYVESLFTQKKSTYKLLRFILKYLKKITR
ncbi:MAG: lipopolysaccharide biosynthesis protein [Promethearchaeota archaeon]